MMKNDKDAHETKYPTKVIVINYQGFKGFGALRLKLYLELSFRILNKILRFNFKLHFEPQATKKVNSDK